VDKIQISQLCEMRARDVVLKGDHGRWELTPNDGCWMSVGE